jgi:hypothetical protein
MDMTDETTQRDLGRLEGKMDGLEDKIDTLLASLPEFNRRLSDVEQFKWRTKGVLSAITGAMAVIAWFVGTLISLKK